MKTKDAALAMLILMRDALQEAGIKVQADQEIKRLKSLLDAGGDVDTAVASMAAIIALMRPALYHVLANTTAGHTITAQRYLDAEDRTNGKKVSMAEALGVTTQALHTFEKKHASHLALLRAWRAETSTLELMAKRTSKTHLIP
jgi:hypothetical protein